MNLVLLSGGSGQRLWPLSNDIRSKQFIKIFHREDGELESMVQRVYRQIEAVDTDATVTIATSKSQVSAIHNQLGEEVGISVEPCRRDTFPAIALAAAYLKDVQGVGEEESVVVCPVDPYVENDYFEALKALGDRAAVSSANLVLMGIEPTYPSEKYGYIIPIGKEQVSKVSMDMGEQIAAHYGLRTINVLTGFKFIGEQIGKLEQQGKADSYVFGFEESYGYLTGSYVRDKDGVDGAYMICEMLSYYATKGISLLDKLEELYKTYGYCLNTLHSYEFDGSAGFAKMQSIMQAFRGDIKVFGGKKVVKLLDYAPGLDGLPKSDVLKFLLEDNCSIVVRPSGTEPKLKTYISVSAEDKEAAEKVEAEICKSAEKFLK